MFDLFFSFHFLAVGLLIVLLSIALAYLCATLHNQLVQTFAGEWLVQHIYCPFLRVVLLVIMTLALFPAMVPDAEYAEMLRLFADREYLTNMVNILMVTGLLLTFLPLLHHPAVAFPALGCIATAILFERYFNPLDTPGFSLLPGAEQSIKLLLLIIVIYWGSRFLIQRIAEFIDQTYMVTGSKIVVTDIVYLIAQIPVILSYAHSLMQINDINLTYATAV